MDDKPPLKGAW